jgi:hypothetical protein
MHQLQVLAQGFVVLALGLSTGFGVVWTTFRMTDEFGETAGFFTFLAWGFGLGALLLWGAQP